MLKNFTMSRLKQVNLQICGVFLCQWGFRICWKTSYNIFHNQTMPFSKMKLWLILKLSLVCWLNFTQSKIESEISLKKGLNSKLSPKFLFKKALNLKLSPKFLFKNFFYKILKELTKNDHKSLNHIQIHNLGHFLGKNIPWLNLVLVLLLKWSIVPFESVKNQKR